MIKPTFTNSFYFVLILIVSFVSFTSCNPTDSKNASAATTTSSSSSNSSNNGDIAYVNLDTLNTYYDYLVDIKDITDKKQTDMRRQLEQSEIQLQSEAESFQKRATQGLLSENAAKKEQQDLQTRYQMLERQKGSMSEALMLQGEKDMAKAYSNIESVLEEYKAEKGYKVVLGTQKGMSVILYTDKDLDITKAVLERLNGKYKSEKDSVQTAK